MTPILLIKSWHTYFNSIKVQLELLLISVPSLKKLYFNSIKVQLEQSARDYFEGGF